MDKATVEKKYMKIIKTCGTLCGIWPEQNKFSKYAMRSFIYIFASTSLFTQVANLVYFYSIDLLTWQLCFMVVVIGILVKQGNYVINSKQPSCFLGYTLVRQVNITLENSCLFTTQTRCVNSLVDQFTGFGFSCATLSFVEPSLMPIILDVILPKNESRDIVYCFPAYYMIDDRKYRTLISIHMVCTCYGIYYVFAGCDANYMFIVQHACGQLAVAGYRFKNAVSDLSNVKHPSDVDKIYERVLHSIRGQQRAMKFVLKLPDGFL
ncbi:unnamed protein product [Heterotrigona itama]|uniref:Odorant receptor n=1 Tax=Heterotrigona itama TaxID=395501 RepID=A0A6V7HA53_9HYME|nr:unnamed protein product [Heterotrigona itama]